MDRILWFDVEDLFHYVRGNSRPSGIQRVAFETYQALERCYGDTGRIRFVRHTVDGRSLAAVSWAEVERTFSAAISRPSSSGSAPSAASQAEPPSAAAVQSSRLHTSPLRAALRRLVYRLPTRIRQPLILFVVLQSQSIFALARCVTGLGKILLAKSHRAISPRLRATTPASSEPSRRVLKAMRRADLAGTPEGWRGVLVVLGSPWFHEEYAWLVRKAREELSLDFAMLLHDIIPLRHPEWCHDGVVRTFRKWHLSVLPLCDVVFSNSRATAADIERYVAENGIRLPGRVHPVPLGNSFGSTSEPAQDSSLSPQALSGIALPAMGSYVLLVSTIEARKNHMLMFRIWRQLLEDLPPEQVPTLVFAGRVGWLVADLMQQLENASYLGNKVQLVRDPSDKELRQLYRGCLFTLFPSLYEGWGLPVTESLALGKPCLASNSTSLPEAGGAFARYFDPEDFWAAYRVVRGTLENQHELADWEARIVREFCPVSWDETARAIVKRLSESAPKTALRTPSPSHSAID